jgi:argininosuccinate lyase
MAEKNNHTAESLLALRLNGSSDWSLAQHEIASNRAHLVVLKSIGYLNEAEELRLDKGFTELASRITKGMFVPKPTDQDVHQAVLRGITEMLGPDLASKVKIGRTKAEQSATMVRLFLLEESKQVRELVLDLIDAFTTKAHSHLSEVMPGRSNYQISQPVLISHQILSYIWPLVRDLERLAQWRERAVFVPYGSGEFSGTSLQLDAGIFAQELGLGAPMANSIDAVTTRDISAEFVFIASTIALNLSRFANDVLLWSTQEFDYVSFASEMSLEQIEIAQLVKGKSNKINSDLTAILNALASSNTGFSQSLDQGAKTIFEVIAELKIMLPATKQMGIDLIFNSARLEELAGINTAFELDIVDWLVRNKIALPQASMTASKVMDYAKKRGFTLAELTDAELASISPSLTPELREVLNISGSIKTRTSAGGSSVARVLDQISALRRLVPEGSR